MDAISASTYAELRVDTRNIYDTVRSRRYSSTQCTLCMYGDVLVMRSPTLVLTFQRPREVASSEVLSLLHDVEPSAAEWGVLYGRVLDDHMYVPFDGPEARKFRVQKPGWEPTRELFASMTTAFAKDAIVLNTSEVDYDAPKKRGEVSTDENGAWVFFPVVEDRARVLALPSDQTRVLVGGGFTLSVGRELPGKTPLVALQHEECGAVGILAPLSGSGVTETPDGVWCYQDAQTTSWISVAQAVDTISGSTELWDPRTLGDDALRDPLDLLDERGRQGFAQTGAAVGALVWNGVGAQEIMELLLHRREAARAELRDRYLSSLHSEKTPEYERNRYQAYVDLLSET